MIKKISTTYIKRDKVHFIIDDNKKMNWIGDFRSDKYKRFFVIIDKTCKKIWGKFIIKKLHRHRKKMLFFEVEVTEKSKSLDFYPRLIEFLEDNKCNLYDLVIAVGGGIVIDLAGFTASTYMRGLPLITIPTTLIGQIDASTAGKTCLNTNKGKNILGTFYYPIISYNNINFLKTNPKYYLRQGYSEVFKYGLLKNRRLIDLLLKYGQNPPDNIIMKIVELSIETRIKIRKKHPLASNLGHTFGHAIEKMSNYKILHGDAISIGIIAALYFSEKVGLMKKENVIKIVDIMKRIGLNIYLEKNINADRWVELMMSDKKSSVDTMNLVLIRDIGKPYEKDGEVFFKANPKIVKNFLKEFIKNYYYIKNNCQELLKKDKLVYTY